jgi:hypothetical protein
VQGAVLRLYGALPLYRAPSARLRLTGVGAVLRHTASDSLTVVSVLLAVRDPSAVPVPWK